MSDEDKLEREIPVAIVGRKQRVFAEGMMTHFDPHDGYIGNPEKWCTVRVGRTPLSFRAPAGAEGRVWQGQSRRAEAWGFVGIVEVAPTAPAAGTKEGG